MTKPTPNAPSSPLSATVPGALLVVAVVAAYANTLTVPFVFDDLSAVVNNPTIRQLGTALDSPPSIGATTGRPLANLSLALNYAMSGQATWSYHALNLAIHAATALLLFGLVRRTLASAPLRALFPEPTPPALILALLWALHPLQTASVTAVYQRTETLWSLLCLATLYCFVRSTAASHPRRWLILSVIACLAGMAAKEVMVTVPLLVLLYDRTFVAGSFAAAWRQRRAYYAALAATWLLLAWLLVGTGGTRGDAAGLGLGISPWSYLLKQGEALILYLKLAFWPHPLVIDYGGDVVQRWTEVWWQGMVVLTLAFTTAWALWRRPLLGFIGAWFFIILAPSSSVVPLVAQTMAEHRMYLPLAAILTLGVLGAWRRWGSRSWIPALLLALVAAGMTVARNRDYRDELTLWTNTVAHRPGNMRAQNNLGIALNELGRFPEAVIHFQEAVRLAPHHAGAQLNLCSVLVRLGRPAEALPAGEAAVRLQPDSPDAHVNLAAALTALGRTTEAMGHYEEALRLQPDARDVRSQLGAGHYDLGNRAAATGDYETAITRYHRALEFDPHHLAARTNLANALLMSGHTSEAIALYRQILTERPDDARVRENLNRALQLGR